MFKGLLTALAVMLGCAVIPVAQFLLAPFGPFIGAYFGIRYVDIRDGRLFVAALRFGISLGVVSAAILILIAVVLVYTVDMPVKYVVLTWVAVWVFAFYVAGMGTLGALYRLMKTPAAQMAPAEAE